MDLRECLDFSLFNPDARSDIDSWATALSPLLSSRVSRIRQLARYSISVSRYRGGSSADGDSTASAFFDELFDAEDQGLLHDGSILLTYLSTAIVMGWSEIAHETWKSWRENTLARIEELLALETGPNRYASLLGTAAGLCLTPDIFLVAHMRQDDQNSSSPPLVPPARYLGREETQVDHSELPLVDTTTGMYYLKRLVDALPAAPLFPVDAIASNFDFLSPALVDSEQFEYVREGLDKAVDLTAGRSAVAARCRTRGMAFFKADKYLDALRELHEAKTLWWGGDTMEGAVLALLVISRVYFSLRMVWASKLYALAVSVIAANSDSPRLSYLIPRGLFQAALCDAAGGAWLASAETMQLAVNCQGQFTQDPWNPQEHEFFRDAVQLHASLYLFLRNSETLLYSHFRELHSTTGLEALLNEIIAMREGDPQTDVEADIHELAKDFTSIGPSDLGNVRVFSWSALGVDWSVACSNDEESVTATERFCAVAQVVLVELANKDPLLLLNSVELDVSVGEGQGGSELREADSESTGRWAIRLSRYRYANLVDESNHRELVADVLSYMFHILGELSAHSLLRRN